MLLVLPANFLTEMYGGVFLHCLVRGLCKQGAPDHLVGPCLCALRFLPTRHYALAGTSYGTVSVSLSVSHKSVFCRNGSTDQAGFWRVGFFRPVLHYSVRKFRYLQK